MKFKAKKLSLGIPAAVLLLVLGIFAILTMPANAAGDVTVQVNLRPSGQNYGIVTSSPAGINCPSTCSYAFPADSTIILTATTIDNTTQFKQWWEGFASNGCSEAATSLTCTFTLPSSGGYYPSATWYDKTPIFASITPDAGQVTSSPAGMNCTASCSIGFGKNMNITFTAVTTNNERIFTNWSASSGLVAGCTTGSTCTINSGTSSPPSLNVTWDWKTYTVNTQIKGGGKGKITSSPATINCSTNCSTSFNRGTNVTFNAAPESGSKFAGWATEAEGSKLCLDSVGKGGASTVRRPSTSCSELFQFKQAKDQVLIAYFEPDGSATTTAPKATAQATAPNINNAAAAAEAGIKDLLLNGRNVYGDKKQPLFTFGKPIVLSGKTVPNGVVKLYIFSTPREATTTADANGDWTYAIKGLETGNHHVEVEVTDPAKKTTSKRVTLVSFAVASAATNNNSVGSSTLGVIGNTKQSSLAAKLIIPLMVVILLLGSYTAWHRIHYQRWPKLPFRRKTIRSDIDI